MNEAGKLHFLSVEGDHLRITEDWFIQNIIKKFLAWLCCIWSLPISVIYHNIFFSIVNCCAQGYNWWRIKYRIINKHLCRGLTLVQCQLYIVFLGQIRAKCRIWSCPKIGAPKIVWQPRIFVGDYQECVIVQWSMWIFMAQSSSRPSLWQSVITTLRL